MPKKRRKKSSARHRGAFGAGQHRPRLALRGSHFYSRPHSPYGSVHKFNPGLMDLGLAAMNPKHRRRRHSYYGNPGVTTLIKHPGHVMSEGGQGLLSAAMAIMVPNWILPFPGTDLMSKAMRAGTRFLAGGLAVMIFRSPASMVGAAIGAGGSTILDLLGTRLIIGSGDTGQTPMGWLSSLDIKMPGMKGLNAYTRPTTWAAMGLRGMDAYMRAQRPLALGDRVIVAHKLF